MSSLTRRIQNHLRRRITDTEDPNYLAPRDGATRKKRGEPFRHVKFIGKPEDVENAHGAHYTKRRSSPAPLGAPWTPHHLYTVPQYRRKIGNGRGSHDGR